MSIKRIGDNILISDETFTDNNDFTNFLQTSIPRYSTTDLFLRTGVGICFIDCVFEEIKIESILDKIEAGDWNEFFAGYFFQYCRFNNTSMTLAETESIQFVCCNGIINFAACECHGLVFSGGNLNVRFNGCNIGKLALFETNQKTTVKIDEFTQSCVNLTWVPEHKDAYEMTFPSDFEPRCPESGAFTAYKKGVHVNGMGEVLIVLEVPEDAKRTSGLSNKCRCEKAIVKSITDITSNESYNWALSRFSPTIKGQLLYEVGATVVPDYFDEEGLRTCSHGIHFFMTREEAEEY